MGSGGARGALLRLHPAARAVERRARPQDERAAAQIVRGDRVVADVDIHVGLTVDAGT